MFKQDEQPELNAFHSDRARLAELGLAYGVCLRAPGKQAEKRAAEGAHLRASLDELLGRMPPPSAPSSVMFSLLPPGAWPPRPDPNEFLPPFDPGRIIPPRRGRTLVLETCRESKELTGDTATYTEFSRSGTTDCSGLAPKSVRMKVSAGQSTPGHPLLSTAVCGYRSIVEFTTTYPGNMTILSAVNTAISWIEANTYPCIDLETGNLGGGGGAASAVVRCGMSARYGGAITSPAETTLDAYEARGHDQVSYAVGIARSAEISAKVSIPSAGTHSVIVDEWISMIAAAADAHAFISATATWNPVEVKVLCGCLSMRVETLPSSFGDVTG